MLGIPEPQHSQGKVLLRRGQGRHGVQADLDRRAERLPRSARPDHPRLRQRDQRPRSVAAAYLATMFDEELGAPAWPRPDPRRRRQRRRLAAELRPAGGHAGDRRRERLGPGRDVVRQPRVRLRRRAAAGAPGAGRLPVPRHEHRRRGHRRGAGLGDPVEGVPGQRRQGRRDRRRARGDARAGVGGRHRGPGVPRRGAADRGRVRAAGAARRQGAGRGHPRGHRDRQQPDRQHAGRALGRTDPRRSPTSCRARRSTR